MSSPASSSELTCSGTWSAAESTSKLSIRTSTSPVASLELMVSGERLTTRPVMHTTDSRRTFSTSWNAGSSTSVTHWVMP